MMSDSYNKAMDQTLQELAKQHLKALAWQINSDCLDNIPLGESGDLRNSFDVADPIVNSKEATVEFGYASEYAYKQHEEMLFHVQKPPINGESFSNYASFKMVQVGKRVRKEKPSRYAAERYWSGYYNKVGKYLAQRQTPPAPVAKYKSKFLENQLMKLDHKYIWDNFNG